tara:strand:- start:150 stop:482 length:333 start_codon:yes stop_codon:yes gene_type:complete
MDDRICPLCLRSIPADVAQSKHHLIPKLKGGKIYETVILHHICHKEIHASFPKPNWQEIIIQSTRCGSIQELLNLSIGSKTGQPISIRAFQKTPIRFAAKAKIRVLPNGN